MSFEITISGSLSASKGGVSISTSTITKRQDMAGADMALFTQVVGTDEEVLAIPADIAAIGQLLVANLDATNYCWLYFDTGAVAKRLKIEPGGFLIIQPEATTIYVKANAAPVSIAPAVAEA